MEPKEATTMSGNAGMMGIGDFSPGSTNASNPLLVLDAKLDIDGDLRIRKVVNNDNLEQVLVIDPNDQNRVRFRNIPAGGGSVNAFNGTSINPGNNQVQLGQWLGVAPAYPAQLMKSTEIPLNQLNLHLTDNSGYENPGFGVLSIGVDPDPAQLTQPLAAKLTVVERAQLEVANSTSAIYGVNRDKEQTNADLIIGIKGRSDQPDNIINVGGLFKGSRAQSSIGVVGQADSSASRNIGGSFAAFNPGAGAAKCTGINVTAQGSLSSNISGTFLSNANNSGTNSTTIGVNCTAQNGQQSNTGGLFISNGANNSVDIGIYARANTIGSPAIQPVNDFAASFIGNVFVDGVLSSAGNLGWSDVNLKENIDTIANALDSINLLKPAQYSFKAINPGKIHFDNKRHFGFIAQEVESVYPNLVSTNYTSPRLDSIGQVEEPGVPLKALDYQSIIALAVKAIQELDQKVTTQDSLITALNNQLQSCCSYNSERTSPDITQPSEQTTFQIDVHLNNSTLVYLGQNAPNPFIEHTVINFVIPTEAKQVEMQFFDADGKQIQSINIAQRGSGLLNVYGENLSAGTYTYVLVIDGKIMSSKRMMKTN
jgi:hypothetical protein